jgi:hypothetical protein
MTPFTPDAPRETVLLGGWIFADLMLALAMLFFSANTRGVIPPPTSTVTSTPTSTTTSTLTPTITSTATQTPIYSPTATPSRTPSPTVTPTATFTPTPVRLQVIEKTQCTVDLTQNQWLDPNQLRAGIQQQCPGKAGKKAGLVLTFGKAVVNDQGVGIARQVNQALPAADPDTFGDASFQAMFYELSPGQAGDTGGVQLWIFYYTTEPVP